MKRGFADRRDGGRQLAKRLKSFARREDAIVLGLPRGGVPVAYEVARALGLSLDVFVVRKLGVPGHEELAFGAIASGGVKFINEPLTRSLHMSQEMVDNVVRRERLELERRERLYRGNRPPLSLTGKSVIVVDDGLATGSTMRAAITAVEKSDPKEVIVAVPVCSPDTCAEFDRDVDVWCACVIAPEPFYAVGLWYAEFGQTSDEEVQMLLARADAGHVVAMHNI